ncbi:MAG: RIP metalloprotease RseP [Lachnospiraceae bacterium]|nr:RIP metalloprotease RseP [Lachnospiraceae bacterium]
MYYVLAILIFGFLIFIHELGHYTTARLFGVTVYEFAIGMGPKLLTHVSAKTGIRYSLRLLPFGGFVSMAGEDEESEDENALNKKPVWQRIIITAAGAFMNLVIGVILIAVVVCSTKALGSTVILKFDDGAVSESAGLRVGDRIAKIGTQPTRTADELSYAIMRQGAAPVDVTVVRGGEKVTVRVDFSKEEIDGMVYGAPDFVVRAVEKNVGTVLSHTWYRSILTVRMIWESLFDLVTGRVGMNQVSGPVGVTQAMAETAKAGFLNFVYLSAVIAINLGVVNLLPLPALDGGRIFFLLIELIRGKPLNPEVEGYIHFAGLAVLMVLMVVITCKDVLGLFRG